MLAGRHFVLGAGGGLSSFLDNAPTYLVFFELAGGNLEQGRHRLPIVGPGADLGDLLAQRHRYLTTLRRHGALDRDIQVLENGRHPLPYRLRVDPCRQVRRSVGRHPGR